MKTLITIWAGLLFPIALAAAQPTQGPPLLISGISQQGSNILFGLTNVSQKEVRADVIVCSLRGADGQELRALGDRVEVAGLQSVSGANNSFKPGMRRQGELRGIPRNENGTQFAACELSVDYVLFADGSTWGPNKAKESKWITGFIAGYNQQTMTLQSQLRAGRSGVVLGYIKSFHPVPWFAAPAH